MEEGSGERGKLVSQEQQLKRDKRGETYELSKAKMYSVLFTILVLFGLLIATNLRDWRAFRDQESVEVEVVGNVIDQVMSKEVKIELINPEAVEQEAEQVEEALAVMAEIQADEEKQKREEERRKKQESERDNDAETLERSEKLTKKKGKEKAGKEREKDKLKRKKGGGSVKCQRESTESIMKKKIEYEKFKTILKKMTIKTSSDRRKYDVEKSKVEKLFTAMNEAQCITISSNSQGKKKSQGKYKNLRERYYRALENRNITLPPEVEEMVKNYDGSLKPPEYCYTSPKGNKAYPREPEMKKKKKEANEIKELDLKTAQEILRIGSVDYNCLILHQDCMNQTYNKQAEKYWRAYNKSFFKNSKLSDEEKLGRLQDFKKLRLGSCAIVGNADNVIKGKYGKEIDEHDFIIRYNVITKPYQEAVGSRTDGLFDKIGYIGTEFAPDVSPTRFNLFPKYIPFELNPEKLPAEKPPLIYGTMIGTWRRDIAKMVDIFKKAKHIEVKIRAYGRNKLQHPSGGVTRVRAITELLKLGVCDRLDLYGFSSGGGKYFLKRMKVSRAHPISAENYVYRLWMATGVHGKFCMYGE